VVKSSWPRDHQEGRRFASGLGGKQKKSNFRGEVRRTSETGVRRAEFAYSQARTNVFVNICGTLFEETAQTTTTPKPTPKKPTQKKPHKWKWRLSSWEEERNAARR